MIRSETAWSPIARVSWVVGFALWFTVPVTTSARAAQPAAGAVDEPAEEEPDEPLPKLSEMQRPPTVEQLVKGPAVDWVVLDTDEVLVTNPVFPRPRPLELLQEQIDKITERKLSPERRREELLKLRTLTITLPDDEDEEEYELDTDRIAMVLHHEDLLLERVGKLIDDSDFRGAYELLFPLARRKPPLWPGVEATEERLLYAQAEERRKAGRIEEALVFYEELFDRNDEYPEVKDRLANAGDGMITAAVADEDFRRARHFLGRIRKRIPDEEVVAKWTDDLRGRATALMERTQSARAAGRHDEAALLVRDAADRWPETSNLRELHRLATSRWQRLRIGVRRLPSEEARPLLPSRADERRRRLETIALFNVVGIDRRPLHRHSLLATWTPTDLGRTVELTLRGDREGWESSEPVTAHAIARSLSRRLDPEDEHYDERLDGLVRSVVVRSPFRLSIDFERAPLSPESLLSSVLPDVPVDTLEPDGPVATRGRFAIHERTGATVSYRRAVPEADGLDPNEYHIAEVVERQYDDWDTAVQGLMRGDVDALPELRPRDVELLVGSGRFSVRKRGLPRTHLLQFNPASKPLGSRQLRRSLGHAINRERILAETFLGSRNSPYGRISTGMFASDTVFYNGRVEPRPYDLVVAISLRLVARKELKSEIPELKLLVVGDEEARAAAEAILADWKRAGINARILEPAELAGDEPPAWDLLYRVVQLGDPLGDPWPLLTVSKTARVADLEPFPDWLRKDLVALDRVATWSEAEQRLRQLHVDLHSDARILPLWEIDDYYAVRDTLRLPGTSDRTRMHLYEDVERWIVRDVYPEANP